MGKTILRQYLKTFACICDNIFFTPTNIHDNRVAVADATEKMCIEWFVKLPENTAVLTHALHAT